MIKNLRITATMALGAVFLLLCVGCATSGANHSGEIVGGILQGIGQGLSGL